jgi:excisionase family DNA binding protein
MSKEQTEARLAPATARLMEDLLSEMTTIRRLLTDLVATATKPLDTEEAAAYISDSKSHLYQLTSKGQIAHFKPHGKKIYFLKKDLDAYLLKNRRPAADVIEAVAANHVANHPLFQTSRVPRKRPHRPARGPRHIAAPVAAAKASQHLSGEDRPGRRTSLLAFPEWDNSPDMEVDRDIGRTTDTRTNQGERS